MRLVALGLTGALELQPQRATGAGASEALVRRMCPDRGAQIVAVLPGDLGPWPAEECSGLDHLRGFLVDLARQRLGVGHAAMIGVPEDLLAEIALVGRKCFVFRRFVDRVFTRAPESDRRPVNATIPVPRTGTETNPGGPNRWMPSSLLSLQEEDFLAGRRCSSESPFRF